MKKTDVAAALVLTLTVGGVSTSHAYSKRERRTQPNVTITYQQPRKRNEVEQKETPRTKDLAEDTNQSPSNDQHKQSATKHNEANIISIAEPIVETNEQQNDNAITEEIIDYYEEEPVVVNDFSYLGYHYDLDVFSGTGFVPSETNCVYQWTNFPSHYLIEKNSPPGRTISNVRIGTEVIINGYSFFVYDIVYNQENDQEALDMVWFSDASVTMQVCTTDAGDSPLNIYFLK